MSSSSSARRPSGPRSNGPVWRHGRQDRPLRALDPALLDDGHDVVVVGGGLTGVTTALLLARAGHDVVLLEARRLGAGTTGASTAKVSLLQGTTLSSVRSATSAAVARAYVDGNREGQAWLERFADEHGVDVQHRTAFTYATTERGAHAVRRELRAVRAAGLPARWTQDTTLPFSVSGAVALDDQLQVDPVELLAALAAEAERHGATLVEGVAVRGLSGRGPVVARTDHGDLRADRAVIATNLPFLDRGGHFARAVPQRSYALAYETSVPLVDGMYLSADQPSRSLRDAPGPDGGALLLVGGAGHVTGRAQPTSDRLAELDRWTAEWFPGARLLHQWSAQDYRSATHVPWAGPLLPHEPSVLVAGAHGKWGMTNAIAAALAVTGRLLGGSLTWADTLYGWKTPKPPAIARGALANAEVGRDLALGWVRPALRPGSADPEEGHGTVTWDRLGTPTATSRVDGTVHRVSAVCPHLGGILRWNDAERSWDCPLHGSRFAADGSRLEGPATCGLSRRPPGS